MGWGGMVHGIGLWDHPWELHDIIGTALGTKMRVGACIGSCEGGTVSDVYMRVEASVGLMRKGP